MWTSGLLSLKKILSVCAFVWRCVCVHNALRPKEDAVPYKLELKMVVSHHVKSNQGLQKSSQRSSPLRPLSSPLCFPLWCFPTHLHGIYSMYSVFRICTRLGMC